MTTRARPRCTPWILAACLGAALAAAAPAAAPGELVFVERRAPAERGELQALGLAVYYEAASGTIGRADPAARARLVADGRHVEPIGPVRDDAALVVAGLRPGTDLAQVRALGRVLLERENWLLLELGVRDDVERLAAAGAFVTPLPAAPLAPYRGRGAPGAARADLERAPDPLVEKIVAAVDTTRIDALWSDLTSNPPTGTRFSRSQGCRDAAQYCLDTYASLGIPAELDEWDPQHAPNVVATREGAIHPERVYIVEGHLDDLPSTGPAPGADDNASGSVNVLESAHAMNCWAFRNTVRFLNVTGEEQGLLGSRDWAQRAAARGEDIRGVINMDMIGWEGNGDPVPENLDLNYNGPSQWLGERFAENASLYQTGVVVDAFYCPSLTASDHYSFWEQGYDAICGITDNEGYCGHGGSYPDYHTSDDTIAACGDPSLFYGTVRTSVATLAELAEPFKVTFDRGSFACRDTATIVLGDRDLNADPAAAESVSVRAWSDLEPDGEWVVLSERGTDSMLFDGTVELTDVPTAAGDGRLQVGEGSTVHVEYVDALDCDGATSVPYAASAAIDCTAPAISGVGETGVTDTEATIVWATDEPADSVLVWGPETPPANTQSDSERVVDHAMTLTGLTECTVYWYEVRSADEAGNLAVADAGGTWFHFETLGDFGDGLVPCHEGRVRLDRADYSCTDTIEVRVDDMDLNLDPGVVETATVLVTSTSEPDGEVLVLTEDGANSATFRGTIGIDPGPPASDGLLQAADGDALTATYEDADDGTGAPRRTWDVSRADCRGPAISDLRFVALDHARTRVEFTTDEPGTTVVEWGPTPALGQVARDDTLTTTHALDLADFDTCETVYLRVSSEDAHGTRGGDGAPGPLHFASETVPGLYWREDFESGGAGWDLFGEWEIGTPAGLGGSTGRPDPARAWNRGAALGDDLSGAGSFPGDYEPNAVESAWSPELDGTSWSNTALLLRRRLNTGAGDDALIWLHTDAGRPIWSSNGGAVLDADWQLQRLDVAQFADGFPLIRLRFEQRADGSGQYSGWNVDEVIFKDGTQPDHAPCGGCTSPPAFAGLRTARDSAACAPGGVELSWDEAPAWGSGGPGSYAVYRGTTADFVPSPATLVAAGVAGTNWTDDSAPLDTDVWYVVRAENDESCGGGPDHGGLTDDNLVRRVARDTAAQPDPAEVTGLRLSLVGAAHVRLEWSGQAGAASYRVYRSASPDRSAFAQLAETGAPPYEDENAGGDGETWYYLVRAVNACGLEGP
ncbi:MAG: hypothetical protein Kow0062_11690 [Acidobacteriota bacterium]